MRENFENNQEYDVTPTSESLERNQGADMIPAQIEEKEYYEAYGGAWRRLAASILDLWPFYLSAILISMAILIDIGIDDLESLGESTNALLALGVLAIIGLVTVGYNIYLYFTKGTTIGYELLGMRIISSRTGRKRAGWPMLGRYFVKIMLTSIPYLGFIFMIVIGFIIGFSKKKQGIHDLTAETVVVIKEVKRSWLVWLVNLIIPVVIGLLAWVLWIIIDPAKEVSKAEDTMVAVEMNTLMAASVISYSENKTFEGICRGDFEETIDQIEQFVWEDGEVSCSDGQTGFALVVTTNSGKDFCLDAYGISDGRASDDGLSCR